MYLPGTSGKHDFSDSRRSITGQVRADPDSDDLAVLAMVTVVPGAWRAADSFSLGGGPVRTSIVGAAGMEATYVVLLDAGAALRWQYLVMVIEEAAEMAGVLLILAGISMALQVDRVTRGVTLRYRSSDRPAEVQPDHQAAAR